MNFKVFDAHCDTLTLLLKNGEALADNPGMVSLKMLRKYRGYIQLFAAYVNQKAGNPLAQAIRVADKFHNEIPQNGFTVIEDAETLRSVTDNDGYGAILTLEDGVALCGDLGILNMLYKLGFRAITLTWNGSNELGEGAVGSDGGGLTDFGKSVVRRMNELGMVVDVSHLSEKGFWDVAEISEKPFIASHSNAKSVCDHARNLTDDQLREIIKCKGAVGINLYAGFLNGTYDATAADAIKHIEHILALGGEDILGIGTDYDGMRFPPKDLENAEKLHKLFDELQKLGYSDELIGKITHKNFERVFAECLK